MSKWNENNVTGVLLTNLGTPDAPTYLAVQRYLREFLSDSRVIEIPRVIWLPLLYGLILPLRPFAVAKKYAGVWQTDGSPLAAHMNKLATALQQELSQNSLVVTSGMRYGNPSIKQALSKLKDHGIRKLIVAPLYPQYSAATTGSTFDAIAAELRTWRFVPEIVFISDYHDFTPYIQGIATSIKNHWLNNTRSEQLLMSFHGLPKKTISLGDPYYDFCKQTASLIAKELGLSDHEWQIVFQSRFGKAEWLQPYCADVLKNLANQGVKSVDVVCPGFAVDCLETLEEISESYAELFCEAGGERLHYIPALNASTIQINLLSQLIRGHL